MRRRSYTTILMIAVGIGALAALWVGRKLNTDQGDASAVVAGITVPSLAGAEQSGKALFGKYCSKCHGQVGEGTDSGPPLIHDFYKPSHHGDAAFFSAALLGARAHHWQFGDMPKVEGITEQEVGDIVAFVRRVQSANGIR